MTGEPLCQPALRQQRAHPLVCSLPHFSAEKWQKLVDQSALKGKRDKKSAQRQMSGCSNLLRGKTSFRFGGAEIRQGAEREGEQNPESRSRVKKMAAVLRSL